MSTFTKPSWPHSDAWHVVEFMNLIRRRRWSYITYAQAVGERVIIYPSSHSAQNTIVGHPGFMVLEQKLLLRTTDSTSKTC